MTTTATTVPTLSDIRLNIEAADIKLVRLAAGCYVAVDTVTGETIAKASSYATKGWGRCDRWHLVGGAQIADPYIAGATKYRHDCTSHYYKRLSSIILQWARGYC